MVTTTVKKFVKRILNLDDGLLEPSQQRVEEPEMSGTESRSDSGYEAEKIEIGFCPQESVSKEDCEGPQSHPSNSRIKVRK